MEELVLLICIAILSIASIVNTCIKIKMLNDEVEKNTRLSVENESLKKQINILISIDSEDEYDL